MNTTKFRAQRLPARRVDRTIHFLGGLSATVVLIGELASAQIIEAAPTEEEVAVIAPAFFDAKVAKQECA